jgi:hypothetical protein
MKETVFPEPGTYVRVVKGAHCGGDSVRVDFIDREGGRVLVDMGGGRKGGLTWVQADHLDWYRKA